MCRLLFIRSDQPFEITEHLQKFAMLCKNSKEYQGHGWGFGIVENRCWKVYKNIKPIWEDDLTQFDTTTLLVAHARSAFRDEGIMIENNMPFYDEEHLFVFNGELRGVKIKAEGRIGAEKIFNLIKRFLKNEGTMAKALEHATQVIAKRTRYVRAMNIIISNKDKAYVSTMFNEDPDYFTLYTRTKEGLTLICSAPYPGETDWSALSSHSCQVF